MFVRLYGVARSLRLTSLLSQDKAPSKGGGAFYTRAETGPLDGARRRDASHTLLRQNVTSSHPRRVFPFYRSFSSLSPLRTQTTPYVFLSLFDSFFLSLPFQTPEYTLFLFLSVSFVSFIIILVTSSSLSSSDNYIPPSLSISRLAHDTRLGSLPTLSLTRKFPSCNIVYIIERIDEYAYLSHLICAQGRSRLPPSNLFSPFFFFFLSQSTQIISLDPRSK